MATLSSHLKETERDTETIVEVYYRTLHLPYFVTYFDQVVRHLGYLWICMIRHKWDHAILFSYETMINMRP